MVLKYGKKKKYRVKKQAMSLRLCKTGNNSLSSQPPGLLGVNSTPESIYWGKGKEMSNAIFLHLTLCRTLQQGVRTSVQLSVSSQSMPSTATHALCPLILLLAFCICRNPSMC